MGYDHKKNDNGEYMKLSETDKLLIKIIEDHRAKVHIYTSKYKQYSFMDSKGYKYMVFGGAFCGNNVNFKGNEAVDVDATQVVVPRVLRDIDTYGGFALGSSALHELVESYNGCLISLRNKKSSPRAGLPGSVYQEAHDKAPKHPDVRVYYLDKDNTKFNEPNENCVKEVFQIKSPTVDGYSWETYKALPYTHSR